MRDATKTILIVDDDNLILTMLKDLLERDFRILTAVNGEHALEILKKEPVAAIVCDHMMPKITGVEVLKQCIGIQPKAVRILVTATESVQDVRDAVNIARVHRVIVKPFRLIEVDGIVKGAVRERDLENENQLLLAKLQERERELENELTVRTNELKEVMDRVLKKT
jgi:response regulator RpfG family c-di-GMP phosphodiesterase